MRRQRVVAHIETDYVMIPCNALKRFLSAKRAEGLSPVTLHWYKRNIVLLFPHVPPDIDDIQPHHVIDFLNHERDRGMSDVTVSARYRALLSFFNWLGLSVMESVKRPRVKKKRPRQADYVDVLRLIDSISPLHWIGLRDRAIISLMLDTGMRVGEVEKLTLYDIDIGSRLITIPIAKDDEERWSPFSDDTARHMMGYLMNRPETTVNALFLARDNTNGLTTWGIRTMFKRRCREAELNYINPHSIRHLFATKALNDGMRIETVSRILGHASVDFTLKTYAKLLTATIQKEYSSYWKARDYYG